MRKKINQRYTVTAKVDTYIFNYVLSIKFESLQVKHLLSLLSSGTAKVVCALLLKYSHSIVGDDVICFIV